MTERAARYADWPRCEGCDQPLPRKLAEARGLVKPVPQRVNPLCKEYRLERMYRVVRKHGRFV